LSEQSQAFARALKRGEIVPFFQSKHAIVSNQIIGFEVLARWEHPTKGVLSPGAFEPMLHDPMFAPQMTRILTLKSLEHYARWKHDFCFKGRLSLNVTSFDLSSEGFAEDFLAMLAQSTVEPTDTTLEVTEHVVLGKTDGAVYHALDVLRQSGVQIALDDFGTGYGGLQHLRCWPVDRLKLDRTFIRDIAHTFPDYAIVRSISHLATELGLTVIAEGIETWAQLKVLRKIGVPFGQGFYFSKPLPAEEVPALFKRF